MGLDVRPAAVTAKLTTITAFRLTTTDPDRLARFYQGIGFVAGEPAPIPDDEMALLGLEGGGMRFPLRIGRQSIDLDRFDRPGRPYPSDATAADLCFQHLAFLVDDARAAWAHVVALGATRISVVGPVTLPAASGKMTAIKFRDPDGHPLELLQVSAGSGALSRAAGLLGINHSAISVSDAGVSRRFYEPLGLTMRRPTFNHGVAQAVLDGLDGAEVGVMQLMPEDGPPHLELLRYHSPRGRPAGPTAANDVAATRTVWAAERDALLRDPDGHLHLLQQSAQRPPLQSEHLADILGTAR